jgi:hypothetical protein
MLLDVHFRTDQTHAFLTSTAVVMGVGDELGVVLLLG